FREVGVIQDYLVSAIAEDLTQLRSAPVGERLELAGDERVTRSARQRVRTWDHRVDVVRGRGRAVERERVQHASRLIADDKLTVEDDGCNRLLKPTRVVGLSLEGNLGDEARVRVFPEVASPHLVAVAVAARERDAALGHRSTGHLPRLA